MRLWLTNPVSHYHVNWRVGDMLQYCFQMGEDNIEKGEQLAGFQN